MKKFQQNQRQKTTSKSKLKNKIKIKRRTMFDFTPMEIHLPRAERSKKKFLRSRKDIGKKLIPLTLKVHNMSMKSTKGVLNLRKRSKGSQFMEIKDKYAREKKDVYTYEEVKKRLDHIEKALRVLPDDEAIVIFKEFLHMEPRDLMQCSQKFANHSYTIKNLDSRLIEGENEVSDIGVRVPFGSKNIGESHNEASNMNEMIGDVTSRASVRRFNNSSMLNFGGLNQINEEESMKSYSQSKISRKSLSKNRKHLRSQELSKVSQRNNSWFSKTLNEYKKVKRKHLFTNTGEESLLMTTNEVESQRKNDMQKVRGLLCKMVSHPEIIFEEPVLSGYEDFNDQIKCYQISDLKKLKKSNKNFFKKDPKRNFFSVEMSKNSFRHGKRLPVLVTDQRKKVVKKYVDSYKKYLEREGGYFVNMDGFLGAKKTKNEIVFKKDFKKIFDSPIKKKTSVMKGGKKIKKEVDKLKGVKKNYKDKKNLEKLNKNSNNDYEGLSIGVKRLIKNKKGKKEAEDKDKSKTVTNEEPKKKEVEVKEMRALFYNLFKNFAKNKKKNDTKDNAGDTKGKEEGETGKEDGYETPVKEEKETEEEMLKKMAEEEEKRREFVDERMKVNKEYRYNDIYNYYVYLKEIRNKEQIEEDLKLKGDFIKEKLYLGRDEDTGYELYRKKTILEPFYTTMKNSNLRFVKKSYEEYVERFREAVEEKEKTEAKVERQGKEKEQEPQKEGKEAPVIDAVKEEGEEEEKELTRIDEDEGKTK